MERKYVLTKLGAGDWLLPSNDTRTVWRINRYDDPEFTGQTHGWQIHRIAADQLQDLMDGPYDPWDWEHWHYWSGGYRTRDEAVKETLDAATD